MTRPLDTWRACGRPFRATRDDRGCTCKPNDPSPWLVDKALDRLADEKEARPMPAPHPHPAAGQADRR